MSAPPPGSFPNGTWPGPPPNGPSPNGPPPNGPPPYGPPPNGTRPFPGGAPNHDFSWAMALMPDTSYVVATCYLSFLCIVAIVMCLKSRTRLRAFACFITYLGLTIAIVGLLRAKFLISPNWFWAWNFLGESSGVVVLALTIVSVGSGFYPMAGNRNLYWRMSIGIIILFGLFSLAHVVLYTVNQLVPHRISGSEVESLRQMIVADGLFTDQQLAIQRWWEQRAGWIPMGDATITGVADWRQLAWAEREMFARPDAHLYLAHQFFMLFTCMWVSVYLFIPLVLHHRQGPVGRPVDSDMMAVGVWYLSSLMLLASVYAVLQLIYCFKQEFIFEQQAQALDLCVRITIGPIFFLPAPAFLLRFYREHFQKFKGNSSVGRNGSGGRNWGSGNNNNGSFNNDNYHYCSNNANGSFNHNSMSQDGTRVGSRIGMGEGSTPRGSFDIHPDPENNKYQEPTSPGGTYTRFKAFHTRDRGLSVESSRVLSRDFECESSRSHRLSEDRPDSFHQYYSNMDVLNQHPLRNSVVMDDSNASNKTKGVPRDPLRSEELPYNVDELQHPKPVLSEQHMRAARGDKSAGRPDMEFSSKIPVISRKEFDSAIEPLAAGEGGSSQGQPERAEKLVSKKSVTGTTGWEMGGYDGLNPNMTSKLSVVDCSKETSRNDSPSSDTLYGDTPIEELTGLQRQLAEHRSALLPQVIAFKAYHEDLANAEPFDHTFKPSPIDSYHYGGPRLSSNDARSSYSLPTRPSEDVAVLERASPSSGKSNRSIGTGAFDPEPKSPSHVVDSDHWSSPTPSSPKHRPEMDASSPYGTKGVGLGITNHSSNSHSGNKPRENKSKEGLMAAFSKALAGDRSGGSSGKGPQPSQDGKDRGYKAEGPSETSQIQSHVAVTVEELAELSVRKREGEIERGSMAYEYSDPYDRAGYKRLQDPLRNNSLNSNTAAVESNYTTKTSSTSVLSKATSTPSLGSSKSRDSISKHSVSSSKDLQSSRPLSPGSKKSNPKPSPRTGRSKSDATTSYRESSEVPRKPSTDLPIMATRLVSPSLPSPQDSPTIPPTIVKTSLSPPPRQSWRRSKSFKNVNSAAALAGIAAIDTINIPAGESGRLNGDPLSSTSATNTSSSSNSPVNYLSGATSEFQSSSVTSPERRELTASPTSYPLNSNLQNSQGHSNDSRTSRERERTVPLSPPLTGLGLSSRLAGDHGGSRHQRSVDNLASAYYYKRASELNNNNASSNNSGPTRDSSGIAVPSSLLSTTKSPNLGSPPTLNSYVFPSYGYDIHRRNSPSPTLYGTGGGGGGSSPSTAMMNAHHLGGADASYSDMSMAASESRSSSFTSSFNNHNTNRHSQSGTNGGNNSIGSSQHGTVHTQHTHSRMLAEDPWTQAMVNRAQAQVKSSMMSGGDRDRAVSPVYVVAPIPNSTGSSNSRPSMPRTASE